MRYLRALLPTLKEASAEATSKSHVLLLRGGYVCRMGAGIYSCLPLGVRVLRKIEAIVLKSLLYLFKDADLIGIPLRAAVGTRGLKAGQIEFKRRSEPDPKKVELLPQAGAAHGIAERARQLLGQTGAKAS